MTTTVGIRSKDGVVLAADKRASKGFFVGSKVVQKIFSLDGATAVAIAGAMSDAEYLVNLAKAERRLLALPSPRQTSNANRTSYSTRPGAD